jgi:hypothetical protein
LPDIHIAKIENVQQFMVVNLMVASIVRSSCTVNEFYFIMCKVSQEHPSVHGNVMLVVKVQPYQVMPGLFASIQTWLNYRDPIQ